MNFIKLISIISIILVVVSCTTTKIYTSTVDAQEIKNIVVFTPQSYIYHISKGNEPYLNDSLSQGNKKLLMNGLNDKSLLLPTLSFTSNVDSSALVVLGKEINYLFYYAENPKNLELLKLTPAIDSLLEKEGERFGLLILSNGFTRISGNYSKEVAKAALKSVLSLGLGGSQPNKSSSVVSAMIVDSQTNKIIFYRKSTKVNKEPLESKTTQEQISDLFNGYFK